MATISAIPSSKLLGCAKQLTGGRSCGGLVHAMVGRPATQTFVQVGPLELKGLPEPVEAVEVLWEAQQRGRVGAVAGRLWARRPMRCSGSSAEVRVGQVGGSTQAVPIDAPLSGSVRRR